MFTYIGGMQMTPARDTRRRELRASGHDANAAASPGRFQRERVLS
jgi:hypothetical protein